MEPKTYTLEEIEALVTALDPDAAAQHRNGAMAQLCRTPVIERIRHNGKIHELTRMNRVKGQGESTLEAAENGRYAACYVRTSSLSQRSRSEQREEASGSHRKLTRDPVSERDQTRRMALDCIEQGWAFRVYNDAGLSGALPRNLPALIDKMRLVEAREYERIFDLIFLKNPMGKYTPAEIAAMEAHLKLEVEQIRTGKTRAEVLANQQGRAVQRAKARKRKEFRPALTVLCSGMSEVHTVVLQDLSRISRSDAILDDFLECLQGEKAQVRGILQELGFLNKEDEQLAKLLRNILSFVDGVKLGEVIIQNLRSIEYLLLSGKPHGFLPAWLLRDDFGNALLDDAPTSKKPVARQMAPVVRRMVELFITPDERGEYRSHYRVATQMNAEGHVSSGGKRWTTYLVRDILLNPALGGYQRMFGRTWQVFPALLTPTEWERVLARNQANSERKSVSKPGRKISPQDGALMRGLLRCCCGNHILGFQPAGGSTRYGCPSVKHARSDGGAHTILKAGDVDDWFDALMTQHGTEIITAMERSTEGDELQRRIGANKEALDRAEAVLAEALVERRSIAEEEARHFTRHSPERYEDALRIALDNQVHAEAKHRDQLLAEMRTLRTHLASLLPTVELQAEALNWCALSTTEKNRILRLIFDCIAVVRSDGEERLRLTLRSAVPYRLPDVVLKVEQRGKPGGRITLLRRMPPLDEWVDTVSLGSRRQGGEGGVLLASSREAVARRKIGVAARDGDLAARLLLSVHNAQLAAAPDYGDEVPDSEKGDQFAIYEEG